MRITFICATFLWCLAASSPAYAYLGPGMGVGALAVVFGIFGSIFVALFALIWYPLRRRFRQHKKDAINTPSTDSPGR